MTPGELWRLLDDAVERRHWAMVDAVAPRLRAAMVGADPDRRTRGVYLVGWQRYRHHAPQATTAAIDEMNDYIRAEKAKSEDEKKAKGYGVLTPCILPWRDPGKG